MTALARNVLACKNSPSILFGQALLLPAPEKPAVKEVQVSIQSVQKDLAQKVLDRTPACFGGSEVYDAATKMVILSMLYAVNKTVTDDAALSFVNNKIAEFANSAPVGSETFTKVIGDFIQSSGSEDANATWNTLMQANPNLLPYLIQCACVRIQQYFTR